MPRTETVSEYDATTGELVHTEQVEVPDLTGTPDLATLADDLADHRARLLAAEDALNMLILNDLGGL